MAKTEFQYRIKDLETETKSLSMPVPAALLADVFEELGEVGDPKLMLEGELIKQGSNVLLQGSLRGSLKIPCQRCLEPAEFPVDVRLNTVYAPPSSRPIVEEAGAAGILRGDDDTWSDDDDLDYSHHDGEMVDLAPLLREQIILSFPITVLCREDCRGLCPQCGKNRNLVTCSCRPEAIRSPLTALSNLKL
jgi:uncharacterized protein